MSRPRRSPRQRSGTHSRARMPIAGLAGIRPGRVQRATSWASTCAIAALPATRLSIASTRTGSSSPKCLLEYSITTAGSLITTDRPMSSASRSSRCCTSADTAGPYPRGLARRWIRTSCCRVGSVSTSAHRSRAAARKTGASGRSGSATHTSAALDEAGQQRGQLVDAALAVEHVGGEHEVPGRPVEHRPRVGPRAHRRLHGDAVLRGVRAREGERVGDAVGGQHVRAPQRRGQRRQPEPAAQLQHGRARPVAGGHRVGQLDPALPHLGPVRRVGLVGGDVLVVEQRRRLPGVHEPHAAAVQVEHADGQVEARVGGHRPAPVGRGSAPRSPPGSAPGSPPGSAPDSPPGSTMSARRARSAAPR